LKKNRKMVGLPSSLRRVFGGRNDGAFATAPHDTPLTVANALLTKTR
jgi:hypothetical protein